MIAVRILSRLLISN